MTSNGNGNSSFYSNANSSTSTLRPRNTLNRLISYEDGSSQHDAIGTTTSTSSTPLRFDSRSTSPSTSTQVCDKTKPQNLQSYATSHSRNTSENRDRRAPNGIWESWSSIQGLASGLLGSAGAAQPARRGSGVDKQRVGRMVQDKNYGLKQAQAKWGPDVDTTAKPTFIEQRQALLQAKRRETVLLQSNEASVGKDSLGRYKRKDSDASINRSPIDNQNDGYVLVYRHKVRPQDTMAGVVIKYSCQPEAFRKVNRFWPNDNIQRKEYVMLPLDACSIRGRKTESPYVADLLQEGNKNIKSPFSTIDGSVTTPPITSSSAAGATEPFPLTTTIPLNSNSDSDSEFKHDSWVVLPSDPQPIEVLRISKRALGYFPLLRRKSQSYSTPAGSSVSTPKSSFDMLRHPPTHAAQQAQLNQQLQSLSLKSSPVRHPSVPHYLTTSSRTRSSSTVSTSNGTASGQNTFLSALQGPGGVGTLRGNRAERAKPGPADDPLNKKFAQYAPDLLPPDHPDYQPPVSNLSLKLPHSRRPSNSIRGTPRASIDSIRSTRSNSSTMPAAIAGWVGKVASSPMRKKTDMNSMHRGERADLTLSLNVLGASPGDPIELADTPDEVSRQLHDAVDKMDDRTPIATPTIEEEDVLNERFPIRGRVRRAYEAE
ncbi:hypothetical protein LTR64_001885 [Lithohypha guttulata]|uniref:uncharacterized protein n=1 Tax=Lithohypha guttulata TaxID=1690604 RepID=UPI002DDE0BA9|nr:hypothetical protein LTR51_007744 [Lithohypha guttulata]